MLLEEVGGGGELGGGGGKETLHHAGGAGIVQPTCQVHQVVSGSQDTQGSKRRHPMHMVSSRATPHTSDQNVSLRANLMHCKNTNMVF
jgi:hypothetical protein